MPILNRAIALFLGLQPCKFVKLLYALQVNLPGAKALHVDTKPPYTYELQQEMFKTNARGARKPH
eukprot:949526-Pyramimonas_sp.AAC.1